MNRYDIIEGFEKFEAIHGNEQLAMSMPPKANTHPVDKYGDNDAHIKEIKPASDLRSWIAKNNGIYYYIKRNEDYLKRYTWKTKSPYYLDYGNHYLNIFLELKPKLSDEGKSWVNRTAWFLMTLLENGLQKDKSLQDPTQYLEYDDNRLLDFAYGTHGEAYDKGGVYALFGKLKFQDISTIIITLVYNKALNDARGRTEFIKAIKMAANKFLKFVATLKQSNPAEFIKYNKTIEMANTIIALKG